MVLRGTYILSIQKARDVFGSGQASSSAQ